MSHSELIQAIQKIPGEEGWHRSCGHLHYLGLAKSLLDKGLTPDEVLETLTTAYWVATGEFGA